MPINFKNIDYKKLLFDGLRSFFALNSKEEPSYLYKYLSAFVIILDQPFKEFVIFRNNQWLIAQCKWQVGQLTNLLNYLYDNELNRIFCTQSVVNFIDDQTFEYSATSFDKTFDDTPPIFEVTFGDVASETIFSINVPSEKMNSNIFATVAQIAHDGSKYEINEFI